MVKDGYFDRKNIENNKIVRVDEIILNYQMKIKENV